MLYSFDFAAQVTRICMNEIRRRGLHERKILRKSATLMQDTLWCSQERIVPKNVWRIINYETCTLSSLSKLLTLKGEQLLIEILDFLVELMQHKNENLMDAYHLGEAMGKVTLGPADCDPIIAEKASHFLTRMIIEHSKRIHLEHKKQWLDRVDSGFARISTCSNTGDKYYECQPMSKTEAARAKAKSYDRLIRKIRYTSSDWATNTQGIRAMLDDDYEPEEIEPEEPWISVFCQHLGDYDPNASPLMFRIISEASKPKVPVPADPFACSYLFQKNAEQTAATTPEAQIGRAFTEFTPLCTMSYECPTIERDSKAAQISHLKKINHSLSQMKIINLRKPRSQAGLESEFSSEETVRAEEDYDEEYQRQKQKHVKSMMRRVMKMNSKKHLQQQHYGGPISS
ncbi:hypothetical protein BDA99DRAFT_596436 [Phascolomyces articulosus]|uniref:Rho-GAP domain-containing protein n=1 Tax=Phascolomyces articulosus TaxID=60185 RepID=A0AAD5K601_9FUNG|nr:hypothetical protein BDA99DRAFT_596436 [Phascolomyces articulosus]